MSTRAFWIWAAILTIADVATALYFYGQMPDTVPTHWNIEGKADAFGNKSIYLWLGPGLMAFGLLLSISLPYLSPAKFKIDPFRETFNTIMFFILLLMFYINGITMYGALHPGQEFGKWLVGGIFLFFSLMGNFLGRIKPNFYMGIRTPWTLASEEVWKRTHRMAGKLWLVGGIIAALLAVFDQFVAALVLILAISFWPAIYSFVLSKRLEGKKE